MKTAPHYSIPEAACRAFAEQEFPIAYGGRPVPGPEHLVISFADAVGHAENLPAADVATADFAVSSDRVIRMSCVGHGSLCISISLRTAEGPLGVVRRIPRNDSSSVVRTAAEVYRRLRAEFGLPKLA